MIHIAFKRCVVTGLDVQEIKAAHEKQVRFSCFNDSMQPAPFVRKHQQSVLSLADLKTKAFLIEKSLEVIQEHQTMKLKIPPAALINQSIFDVKDIDRI